MSTLLRARGSAPLPRPAASRNAPLSHLNAPGVVPCRLSAAMAEQLRHPVEYVEVSHTPLPSSCSLIATADQVLAALREVSRLDPQCEQQSFRAMNQLRMRAELVRLELLATPGEAEQVALLFRTLAAAREIRNALVRVFLPLAKSLACQYLAPQRPLDELLSECSEPLVRAVERFDASRGFRFSTYATHAIRRQLFRWVTRRSPDQALGDCQASGQLAELPARPETDWGHRQAALEVLEAMLPRVLEPRELTIIRARYGLGDGPRQASFREIGERLGISRERVRQLEQVAVRKLRVRAEQLGIDPEQIW